MSNSSQVDEISSIAGMELHLWSPLTLQDEWLIW